MAPKTFGERCHPTDFGSHRHISTYKPKTTRRQAIKGIDKTGCKEIRFSFLVSPVTPIIAKTTRPD